MNIKQTITHNLLNIPGWHTNRKIVVIESDDKGVKFEGRIIDRQPNQVYALCCQSDSSLATLTRCNTCNE